MDTVATASMAPVHVHITNIKEVTNIICDDSSIHIL
jgi:hypothetical protein